VEVQGPALSLAAAVPANVVARLQSREHWILLALLQHRSGPALSRHQTDVGIAASMKPRSSNHGLIWKCYDAALCEQRHPL